MYFRWKIYQYSIYYLKNSVQFEIIHLKSAFSTKPPTVLFCTQKIAVFLCLHILLHKMLNIENRLLLQFCVPTLHFKTKKYSHYPHLRKAFAFTYY